MNIQGWKGMGGEGGWEGSSEGASENFWCYFQLESGCVAREQKGVGTGCRCCSDPKRPLCRHGPEVSKKFFMIETHCHAKSIPQLITFSVGVKLAPVNSQHKFFENFQNAISVHLNKDLNWACYLKMPPRWFEYWLGFWPTFRRCVFRNPADRTISIRLI